MKNTFLKKSANRTLAGGAAIFALLYGFSVEAMLHPNDDAQSSPVVRANTQAVSNREEASNEEIPVPALIHITLRPAPVILGCSGRSLLPVERDFFQRNQPLGFILFGRNIQDPPQLQALIEALKGTVLQANVPILIDQEGGRVARLKPPFWSRHPPSRILPTETLEDAKVRVQSAYTEIARELRVLGITHNCAPVLDLDIQGANPIMGDRTFSPDPAVVSALGAIAIQALNENGITPIMKHIPGHGAALCDSHLGLPVVNLSIEELESHFAPFRANAQICPWAMTAHIVYLQIDHLPATQSPRIIREIIRGAIGFKGFLISDDLGMDALSGGLGTRARLSLEAGVDAVLHCSGILSEMQEVMEGILHP